ncbi:MAG TPA: response regulator transcription factor [Terriglobia bacterium]|nr:response regulator transcription factor [Terriglobia bacterium]
MSPLRILVVDDHSIVRRGVRALLESENGWSICGEASTGAEAILQAKRLKPDIIVMDISMPELDGLEATRQIHAALPETPILILSMHDSHQHVREMLDAGARGYLLKSDIDRILPVAIQALRQGKNYFSPNVSQIVLDGFLKGSAIRPRQSQQPSQRLTPRQREIVQLLAEGRTNKEIAAILGVSTKTVEAHRAHVMQKLELQSFSDLIRYAVREHIVKL